jgi:8-hydroxy-5-deazaflavin:NADPH oxidoreductase
VIFLSGNDAEANAAVGGLFEAAEFFPIVRGGLVAGGRLQQIGGPLPAHNLVRLPPGG